MLVSKIEDAEILVAIIRPLFACYVKIQSSSLMELLQEGRTFDQRLRTLLETKLLKKKLHLGKWMDLVICHVCMYPSAAVSYDLYCIRCISDNQ